MLQVIEVTNLANGCDVRCARLRKARAQVYASPDSCHSIGGTFIDVSDGLAQCFLLHSQVATLPISTPIDAHACDTAVDDLGKLRRARVAPTLAICTLGEIRSHNLQSEIKSG